MDYKKEYKSPLGRICLTSNGDYLTGLWFENSKDSAEVEDGVNKFVDLIKKQKLELRIYTKQPY